MKYAFAVMLAVYLVTFGCNPKSEKEHSSPQEKTEHASVEKAPVTPAPPGNIHVTSETAPPAAPTEVILETKTAVVDTPQAGSAVPSAEVEVVVITPEAENESTNQWQAIAQSAATTVLALMSDDAKQEAEVIEPTKAEAKAIDPAPAKEDTGEKETVVTLPCGKNITLNNSSSIPPCLKHGYPMVEQPAVPAEEAELSEAMQNMVNATNDMVTVTRQLVITTQQMLAASKEVAVEFIETGKEAIETSKPAVQNAVNEKELIKTVKEVVSATKEAFDATSEALSKALEAKEAKPVQEAVPQQ